MAMTTAEKATAVQDDVAVAPPRPHTGRRGSVLGRLQVHRFSGLYLWLLMIVGFGLLSPDVFLTLSTAKVIASQQAVAGILALAVLLPMVCGEFDLSVGANANLMGLTAAVLITDHGFSAVPAALFVVLLGALVGAVNGLVVTRLKVSSFITTLGMGSILAAFQIMVTGGLVPLPPQDDLWSALTQTRVFGFHIVIGYLIVLAFLAWWLLDRTAAGRRMYATGGNREAARLSGVRVDRWSVLSLTASGAISALGGVLFVSLTGPSVSFGGGLLLPAFAAVFLGSTQLFPGRLNVWGAMLAVFVLATGTQGLQIVSGYQWVSPMFNGVALIGAVAVAMARNQGRST